MMVDIISIYHGVILLRKLVSYFCQPALAIYGSYDNTVKVWNTQTVKELLHLKEHANWVKSLAVTPNNKQIISDSYEGTIKV